MTHILDELEWRGLIAQTTDLDALRDALSAGPVSLLLRLRPDRAEPAHRQPRPDPHGPPAAGCRSHARSALVGGATGLIGDPKMAGERTLNDRDVVSGWVERIRSRSSPCFGSTALTPRPW